MDKSTSTMSERTIDSANQQRTRESISEITPQFIQDMREKEVEREQRKRQQNNAKTAASGCRGRDATNNTNANGEVVSDLVNDDDDVDEEAGMTNRGIGRVVTPFAILDQQLKEMERQEQQQDRSTYTLEENDNVENVVAVSKPGAYAVVPTRTTSAVAAARTVVGVAAENIAVEEPTSQQQQQVPRVRSNNDKKTTNGRKGGRSSTSSSMTSSIIKKRSGSPGLSSCRTSRRKPAADLPSAAATTTTRKDRQNITTSPARHTTRSRTPPPPPQRRGGEEGIENHEGSDARMADTSSTDNTTGSGLNNNNVESLDNSPPPTQRMSTSRSNNRRFWSSTTSVKIEAQKVDDAEMIFYAEDAHVDNFRRRLIICGIVAVVICAITITVALVFRPQDDDEKGECEFDDNICCVDFENDVAYPRVIPLLCHCVNSTEVIYESLTSEEKEIREFAKIIFIASGLIEKEVIDQIDPTSCHPYNQALLALSKPDELGLDKATMINIPISVLQSLLAIFIIFENMDGIHWEHSGEWLEHHIVCDYFGIDCLFIDSISTLLLQQNGLKGTIPTEIGLLEALRGLDLSANSEITGRIPTQMESMTSLKLLDLSETSLSGPIPTLLGSLTSLNTLSLGSTKMTGTIPSSIFQLSSINFLSLSNNKLHGTLSTEFGHLTDIDVLRLNLNNLTGSLPNEMLNMSNLGLLHIGGNNFRGSVPDFLGRITSLQNLDIMTSGLTGTIPETFCTGYWRNNTNRVGLRQIVMDCDLITRCSCCDNSGNGGGVRIICGDAIPDTAIGNGI